MGTPVRSVESYIPSGGVDRTEDASASEPRRDPGSSASATGLAAGLVLSGIIWLSIFCVVQALR